jgi:Tol biopolymer transport system component
MRHRRLFRAVLGAGLASVLLALTAPTAAHATFPGANGRIAFTSNLHGSWQLYTMRPNGTGLRQVTHIPGSPREYNLYQSWSPSGRKLAFIGGHSGNLDIYTINADGTGIRQVTSNPADDDTVSWSPDGTQFLFARRSDFGTFAIWRMNVDGSHQVRLTSPSYDSAYPMYTPDGRHIAFQSTKGGLISAVWIMNADGANQHRLTPAPLRGVPRDVSPDGKNILVENNAGVSQPVSIYVMRLDGTGLKRLTNAGCCVHDANARYSPNGTTIAFTTNRGFASRGLLQNEIWEMTADGRNQHPVTSSLTLGGCPDEDNVDNCTGPATWGRQP